MSEKNISLGEWFFFKYTIPSFIKYFQIQQFTEIFFTVKVVHLLKTS